MTGGNYERELKDILVGKKKTIEKITASCSDDEKENYLKICDKPFAVIRAAGSLGVDLVAIRSNVAFLIEVKSSANKTLHFSTGSGKPQKQAERMLDVCKKTRTLPVYAYRLKSYRGDFWRMFSIDLDDLEGNVSILHRRLPKLEKSHNGNFVMKWQKGMPLSDFISYLCD